MRGRLRGKGRRPGGGAGNTGADLREAGSGEDCGVWEEEQGCIWTEELRDVLQDRWRSKSHRGTKELETSSEGEEREGTLISLP